MSLFSRAKSCNNERHEDRGSILNKREPIKRAKRVTILIFSPDNRDRACRLRGSRPRRGGDTDRGPKPGGPEPRRLVQMELRIRKRDQGARGGPLGERWPRERGDERAGKLQLSQWRRPTNLVDVYSEWGRFPTAGRSFTDHAGNTAPYPEGARLDSCTSEQRGPESGIKDSTCVVSDLSESAIRSNPFCTTTD